MVNQEMRVSTKLVAIFCTFLFACGGTASNGGNVKIYVNYKEILTLPEKYSAGDAGKAVHVEKGKEAKIGGLIFPTKKAMEYAKLKIRYEELYSIATVNKKLATTTVDIANKKINEADKEIDRLRGKQDSWWNRNKVVIGVLGGFTVGVTLSGVIVWGAFRLSNK